MNFKLQYQILSFSPSSTFLCVEKKYQTSLFSFVPKPSADEDHLYVFLNVSSEKFVKSVKKINKNKFDSSEIQSIENIPTSFS